MNISNIKDCYGCGVCATACPKKIIKIEFNESGFYEPRIDDLTLCIDCSLCTKVCSFIHDDISLKNKQISSYAAWSNDEIIRSECSSGGVAFELSKYLLTRDFKVCAVRYNTEKNRAEHYVASTLEELWPSMGSKYIQSYTLEAFQKINIHEKYLVTGTPCQIDSFRRYIQLKKMENNFVLMDFFCHGTPSIKLWKKYLVYVEKKIGKISYVSWRNKLTGWHDSWAIAAKSDSDSCISDISCDKLKKINYYSRLSKHDVFYTIFLNDSCLGKACYNNCKYKYKNSAADIRIGDLWGKTYYNDEKGTSCAISFTNQGDKLLKELNCTLIQHPFHIVAEGQLKFNPKYKKNYNKIRTKMFDEVSTIEDVYKMVNRQALISFFFNRLRNPHRTISNILKRMKHIFIKR